jgi:hypothetical protein
MKRIYSLYAVGIALVLASGILLSNPPTVLAAECNAKCEYGSNIYVSGTKCSCEDNVGCTFTNSQGTFTQKCATKGGDEFEIEAPPAN